MARTGHTEEGGGSAVCFGSTPGLIQSAGSEDDGKTRNYFDFFPAEKAVSHRPPNASHLASLTECIYMQSCALVPFNRLTSVCVISPTQWVPCCMNIAQMSAQKHSLLGPLLFVIRIPISADHSTFVSRGLVVISNHHVT